MTRLPGSELERADARPKHWFGEERGGIGVKSKATSVAAYLEELPAERRQALSELRALIRKAAPNAVEAMQYGMPSYAWGGMLFSLASQKGHMALYVCDAPVVQVQRARLGKLKCGKGCIRFRSLDELPLEVITDILREAVERRNRSGVRAEET